MNGEQILGDLMRFWQQNYLGVMAVLSVLGAVSLIRKSIGMLVLTGAIAMFIGIGPGANLLGPVKDLIPW